MYQVNIKHFYMVEYIENDKIMKVEVDLREEVVQIAILCIRGWDSPNENITISKRHKNKIAKRIKSYLERVKGMECEIVY